MHSVCGLADSGMTTMSKNDRFPPMPKDAPVSAEGEPKRVNAEQLVAWDPLAQRARWRVPLGNAIFAGGGVLATGGWHRVRGKCRR
jgi:hypothetical protein